jgi:hypothetical protein
MALALTSIGSVISGLLWSILVQNTRLRSLLPQKPMTMAEHWRE